MIRRVLLYLTPPEVIRDVLDADAIRHVLFIVLAILALLAALVR